MAPFISGKGSNKQITFFLIGKKKFYWKMISMRKHKVHDSEQEEERCKKKANKH